MYNKLSSSFLFTEILYVFSKDRCSMTYSYVDLVKKKCIKSAFHFACRHPVWLGQMLESTFDWTM